MPDSEARSRARAFELLLITTATSAFRRPALQASITDCIVEPSCDARKPSLMPTPVPSPITCHYPDQPITARRSGHLALPKLLPTPRMGTAAGGPTRC